MNNRMSKRETKEKILNDLRVNRGMNSIILQMEDKRTNNPEEYNKSKKSIMGYINRRPGV